MHIPAGFHCGRNRETAKSHQEMTQSEQALKGRAQVHGFCK